MVSSDDVKITESGSSLRVQGLRVFELHPSEVAALRAHFAAETATALRALHGASGVIEQVRAWRNYYLVKPTDPEWDRQATWDVEKLDAILAAYPETRAAERMPEDVQKLVEEVKRLVREGDRRLGYQLAAKGDQAWADQMLDAIQRLEAAYSQEGTEIVRCAACDEPATGTAYWARGRHPSCGEHGERFEEGAE